MPLKKVAIIFSVSLICEISQFIMAIWTSDIKDIITNTLGGIVDLLIMYIGVKLFKNKHKGCKFINIIATIGTIFMIVLLALLLFANM